MLVVLAFLFADEANAIDLVKIFSKELKTDQADVSLQKFIPECGDDFGTNEFFKLYVKKQWEGYVVLTRAKGRHDYFDFLMWYSSGMSVKLVKVVSYSSDHGSEISGKNWLLQFAGYSGNKLIYGKDIQAISGATISGKAITSKIEEITGKLKTCIGN